MQTTIGGPLRAAEERAGDQTSQGDKQLQKEKHAEIVALLVSAGYFRARISTLSEFDKVIGGLCWCIALSGAALDVDNGGFHCVALLATKGEAIPRAAARSGAAALASS